MNNIKLLDCTLRDGGYYNAWDFPVDLVHQYLEAMQAASVDVVELGFRSLKNAGFKGVRFYDRSLYRQLGNSRGINCWRNGQRQ